RQEELAIRIDPAGLLEFLLFRLRLADRTRVCGPGRQLARPFTDAYVATPFRVMPVDRAAERARFGREAQGEELGKAGSQLPHIEIAVKQALHAIDLPTHPGGSLVGGRTEDSQSHPDPRNQTLRASRNECAFSNSASSSACSFA